MERPLAETAEEAGSVLLMQLTRGAREAVGLIRSAVDSPDVSVLATASSAAEVDGFFLDMLEPLSIVEIDYPTPEGASTSGSTSRASIRLCAASTAPTSCATRRTCRATTCTWRRARRSRRRISSALSRAGTSPSRAITSSTSSRLTSRSTLASTTSSKRRSCATSARISPISMICSEANRTRPWISPVDATTLAAC